MDCNECPMSYFTSVGFAGLGFFLSLDRLLVIAEEGCTSFQNFGRSLLRRGGTAAGDLHSGMMDESIDGAHTGACADNIPEREATADDLLPTRGESEDVYHLMDFDALLSHLAEYLREEHLLQ